MFNYESSHMKKCQPSLGIIANLAKSQFSSTYIT